MSDSGWEEVHGGGGHFWVNEKFGNVAKTSDGSYISLIPKVVKLGPFLTLEEAKKAVEDTTSLDHTLERFNLDLEKGSSDK